MHLAIDVREVCRSPLTGKGRWTAGFVHALLKKGIALKVYTDRPLPADVAREWKAADVHVISTSGIFWHLRAARDIRCDRSIDCYVSTVSYIVPCLLRGRKKCVTVVHDLIAFRKDVHDKRATFIERLTLARAVRFSALVCTVSDTTSADLIQLIPSVKHVTVAIYAGCDRPVADAPSSGNGAVVCIGTLCPRKNQLRLIGAFSRLPDDLKKKHPLMLIGSRGWNDEGILDAVRKTDHVSFQEGIDDERKNGILRDAVLCAFPSLYEGFGLPVLEAFSAGIPVVASNGGSLREVADDAACIVDPTDEQSIAAGLQMMLEEPALRRTFAMKGLKRARLFTWEKTADLFLRALKQTGNS